MPPENASKLSADALLSAILAELRAQSLLLQDIQQRLAYQSSRADEVAA